MKTPLLNVQAVDAQITAAAKQAGGIFQTRFGLWLLGMISFVESALIVPIITDPFLVVYILANRTRMWLAVGVTTIASVVGGVVAYAVAVAAYAFLAEQFFSPAGLVEFHAMAERFDDGTFLLTLLGAVTPIPYTVVALAAGFVQANFFAFVLASLLGRGFRYVIVGIITERYGQRALQIARPHVTIVSAILVLAAGLYLFLFKL